MSKTILHLEQLSKLQSSLLLQRKKGEQLQKEMATAHQKLEDERNAFFETFDKKVEAHNENIQQKQTDLNTETETLVKDFNKNLAQIIRHHDKRICDNKANILHRQYQVRTDYDFGEMNHLNFLKGETLTLQTPDFTYSAPNNRVVGCFVSEVDILPHDPFNTKKTVVLPLEAVEVVD